MRKLIILVVLTAAIFAGYEIGKYLTRREDRSVMIQNYSFIKEIAEMASLEVDGTTTFTSTNVNNDGSFTDAFKKIFLEKSVRLNAPYKAKFGIDLQSKELRVEKSDSVIKIYLPEPKLLSYEILLNRMDASNQKGWFQFQNDQEYLDFQKKLYTDSRAQLEKNTVYLNRSRDKICDIIQKYFVPAKVKTICIYDDKLLALPEQKLN
ncbi:MAG: DUF4230 domain-containing protein [Chitinophagaceae bacterium]